MLRTDIPQVPDYGRSNELITELTAFATYAQMYNRTDFAEWLLDAYTAMVSKMPAAEGGD